MSAFIAFNANNSVKVRLTKKGKEIFTSIYKSAPSIDDEGYTEMPMIELIRDFGQYITPGGTADIPNKNQWPFFLDLKLEML
jgi:hypothetical protein